ncbi:unnamed protein product [Clonostachys rosea]|uniref:Uncharacterized protein n=1 Tax=Bionectria ochroleuca TaxID=29856 RepID=A0ABY6TS53_BIOOC|nr:unnamed protein product [Clonostachys rosea]
MSTSHRQVPAQQLRLPHDHPQHPSSDDEATHSAGKTEPHSKAKRIYWLRGLFLLFVPPMVTSYYYWIYFRLILRPQDEDLKFGYPGEKGIYYSWTVISIFVLGWSKYGLAGAECRMLQTRWISGAKFDLVDVLDHTGAPWGGPSGWKTFYNLEGLEMFSLNLKTFLKSLGVFLKNPRMLLHNPKMFFRSFKPFLEYRLWNFLALLSLCVYTALPLSQLSMEIFDGYILPDAKDRDKAMVVGRSSDNLHVRDWLGYPNSIRDTWGVGSPATLPGIGIIYTGEHVDRSKYDGLKEHPHTLPLNDGIPDMFIIPQAEVPVNGSPWGLRASYNCSIVKDRSEFTMLSKERLRSCPTTEYPCVRQYASNSIKRTNVWAYIETAHDLKGGHKDGESHTYNGEEPSSFGPNSSSEGDILEYALWQIRVGTSYSETVEFNSTLEPVVQDMQSPFFKASNGSWVGNDTYFDSRSDNLTMKNDVRNFLSVHPGNRTIDVAPPIGLRCVAVSVFGIAELVPAKMAFKAFESVLVPAHSNNSKAEAPVPRIGMVTAESILAANYLNLFTSIHSRIMEADTNSVVHNGFATPQDVQKSAMLAYGLEILALMYDGKRGLGGSWKHDNLTCFVKNKVVAKGVFFTQPHAEWLAWVSVIAFGIWGLGSFSLAYYGLWRRSYETLDGFLTFKLGVHHADELRAEHQFWDERDAHKIEKMKVILGKIDNI